MTRLTLTVVVCALWLGAALLLAAVVAPAAFAVLPSRTAAGSFVGRVLPTVFIAGCVVALLTLLLTDQVGTKGGFARVTASIVWLVACAVAQFVISPRIERVRTAAGGPIDALVPDSPFRVTFGRLHGVSVGLLGLAMLAALALLLMAGRAIEQNR